MKRCRVGSVFAVFLLFKQKTAYEMRISDWSSDVCSSDLVAPLETWYHGPGPVRSALEQLGEIGMPLRDALYEAAGVAIPSAPPIGAQTSATEIHPRPWTIDPIDAGDVTKYEKIGRAHV